MITIDTIIAQLDAVAQDVTYWVGEGTIFVTIEDFEGFDENWSEIDRELVDADAVDAMLDWLQTHADSYTDDYYLVCQFGEWEVSVGYSSFDI